MTPSNPKIEEKVREFNELRRQYSFQTMEWAENFLRTAFTELYDEGYAARGGVESEQKQRMFEAGQSVSTAEVASLLEGMKDETIYNDNAKAAGAYIRNRIIDEAITKIQHDTR